MKFLNFADINISFRTLRLKKRKKINWGIKWKNVYQKNYPELQQFETK